jgi:glycosyltransferase involved in cell wall biosynthesis
MRVGIDARFLTHPQRGGFKSYTRTVISALAQTGGGHEFVLYADRPPQSTPDLPPNLRVRTVTGGNAIMREQFVLPMAMLRDGIDVAHYLCNTGPIVLGPRMVVTIHDTIPLRDGKDDRRRTNRKQRLLKSYWRSVIPRTARAADLIVADSCYVRDDLCERFGIGGDRLRVVPIAIDPVYLGESSGAPPAGIDPGTPFLLAFGSADGRKNHVSAIQAFDSVVPEFPSLRLVLVCSHPGVRDAVPPAEHVIIVGPVSSDELLWLYRNATALVFPSFDEGFGLPPLESMACGTPVVASTAGSVPEVVGENGIFVDPASVADIAEGMRRLVADSSLQYRLSVCGRRHASNFSLKRMGADLVSVYEAAVSRSGS